MKSISMKAQVMPKITISRVTSVIMSHPVAMGVAGAAACFLGCLADADALMWAGAAVAMLSVKPSAKKGGAR